MNRNLCVLCKHYISHIIGGHRSILFLLVIKVSCQARSMHEPISLDQGYARDIYLIYACAHIRMRIYKCRLWAPRCGYSDNSSNTGEAEHATQLSMPGQ